MTTQKVIYRIPDSEDDSEDDHFDLVNDDDVESFEGDKYKQYPPEPLTEVEEKEAVAKAAVAEMVMVGDEEEDFFVDYSENENEDFIGEPKIDIYPPETQVRVDEESHEFNPMEQLGASPLNSLIALKYEPSAFMVAGTGAEPVLLDHRQVQCSGTIIPGSNKCWKGVNCQRTHGSHTEYRAPSGTMIASVLLKKPPLTGSFMGKITWIISNNSFYLVPYSLPDGEENAEPDPKYQWNIGVEQIALIEKELNNLMKMAWFRKNLVQESYVSGEVVVAYLGEALGWKRAVILSKNEDDYGVCFTGNPLTTIQLIDSGEICLVRYMNLSRLPWKFQKYPPMAYKCTFKDAPLELKETTETFCKMLGKKVFVEVYANERSSSPLLDPLYDYGNAWSRYGFSEKVPFAVELWIQKKKHGVITKCKVSAALARD